MKPQCEESERQEMFTAMLLAKGDRGSAWPILHWVGLVVDCDGDVPFSSGPVGSREEAWAAVRGFLHEWRLAGYAA